MQHVCNHIGAAAGFPGSPTSTSLPGGLGSLMTLGMLFAGLLGAALLLLWATQRERQAHAGFGAFADGERPRRGEEPGPRVTYARYDQPPQQYEVRYEQPEAHYPEPPFERPREGEPGMYD